jgi:hypothetical protein
VAHLVITVSVTLESPGNWQRNNGENESLAGDDAPQEKKLPIVAMGRHGTAKKATASAKQGGVALSNTRKYLLLHLSLVKK